MTHALSLLARRTDQTVARLAFEHAVAVLSERVGIDATRIMRRTAGRTGVSPRRQAIYLARVVCQVPMQHLADVVGVTKSNVVKACAAVEDARSDDVALDRLLDEIELEMAT
jgi:chromosomal replication initiation ATPase DnaA